MTDNRQRRNFSSGKRRWNQLLQNIRELFVKHSKIAFPILLIVCVAVTVVIALNMGKANKQKAQDTLAAESVSSSDQTGEAQIGLQVTTEELQNNAIPEVNALIMDYYNAVASGDVEKVLTLSNNVDQTEQIRIQELSKYIDSYPSVEIYTKPGPEAGSYIAYVNYQVKFSGYDNTAPGIQTFYICAKEDGTLYMNEGAVEQYVTDYIQTINMQEDVVDLFNRVAVEYNDLLTNDPNLGIFLQELNTQMDVSVGEALAAAEAEAGNTAAAEDPDAAEAGGEEQTGTQTPEDGEAGQPEQAAGPTKARTTTTINVRSSDSETADKLGKLEGGTSLDILEVRPNGWSKIMYNGKEAFVKSEYLQMAEDASNVETIGTVTAKDNVNIRAAASETADKLGIVYQGETLDLIEKQNDGWCKVKYKGQIAYVKSEFVE